MPKTSSSKTKKDKLEDSERKPEIPTINGIIIKKKVQIQGEEALRIYEDGYYGLKSPKNENVVFLDAYEASLLLERGRLQINDLKTQENITPQTFIEQYSLAHPEFWEQYLVYKDLRSRGYPVKAGVGRTIDFFVYPRGAKAGSKPANFFVHIVNESTPTTLSKLLQASEYSSQNKRKLVLAISDRTGDITYYEVTSFNLLRKKYS